MMTLSEIRQKHPEYKDVSDQDLADGLYKKSYSDVPRTAFDEAIGLAPGAKSLADIFRARAAGKPFKFDIAKPTTKADIAEGFKRLGAVPAAAVQEARRFAGAPTPAYIQRETQAYPLEASTGRALTDIGVGLPLIGGLGSAGELGGEVLGAAGKYAKPIGGAIGRILGQTGVGAMGAPTGERGMGAAFGATLGTASELVPFLPKLGRGLAARLSPDIQAQKILTNLPKTLKAETVLSNLGEGKNLQENAQSLANKIKNLGKGKLKESTVNYNDIIRRSGDTSIFDETKPISKDSYRILEKWERSPINDYTTDIRDAHNKFMEMPTFGNAHKLQSVMADEAYPILGNRLSNLEDKSKAQGYLKARSMLLSDMNKHLAEVDPTGQLVQDYKTATNFHLTEAIPYKSKQIYPIVQGKIKNPRNLTTIFKNPEENIDKIVTDLGPTARDQLVYNELYQKIPTAKNLLKSYDKLEGKGLDSYISDKLHSQMGRMQETAAQDEFLRQVGNKPTADRLLKATERLEKQGLAPALSPSLRDQLDILKAKYGRAGLMKRGVGALGGAIAGRALRLPFLGEAAGAGLGAVTAPRLMAGMRAPGIGAATTRPSVYRGLMRTLLPYYLAQRGR